MNKYNQLGLELIKYKTELLKEYTDIVVNALYLAIDQLAQTKIIDTDTQAYLKDNDISLKEFSEIIILDDKYIRSNEELLVEYEALREKINEKLNENGLVDGIRTQSYVVKEKIQINKTFSINKDYVMNFFGVNEEELEKLMKRKGFIEKFAVLRLPKIISDFLRATDHPSELFKVSGSFVYYDATHEGYSIDLCFDIPIDIAEDESNIEDIVLNIKDIISNAETYYNSKMAI